jgi:hypothetical protein
MKEKKRTAQKRSSIKRERAQYRRGQKLTRQEVKSSAKQKKRVPSSSSPEN